MIKKFAFLFWIVPCICFAGGNGYILGASQTCVATETPETSCADSIDNDCDGLIDGADTDCGTGCSGTYGLNSGASSTNPSNQYQIVLNKITIDCSGTVSYVEQYLSDADLNYREVKYVIYDDDGGSGEPGTRLYTSAAVYNAGSAATLMWLQVSGVSLAVTPGDYWVGTIYESTATDTPYEVSTGQVRSIVNADFNPPASWNTAGDAHFSTQRVVRIGF